MFTIIDRIPAKYQCLSTDVKSTAGIPTGAELTVTDTGAREIFDGTSWVPQSGAAIPAGSVPISTARVTLAHTAPSIGVATTAALAANANRRYALIVNDSDTVIYISFHVNAALNTGIRINANGGSYEMSEAAGNIDTRAINAISSVAAKTLLVTEGA